MPEKAPKRIQKPNTFPSVSAYPNDRRAFTPHATRKKVSRSQTQRRDMRTIKPLATPRTNTIIPYATRSLIQPTTTWLSTPAVLKTASTMFADRGEARATVYMGRYRDTGKKERDEMSVVTPCDGEVK